jgi:pyruvate dehydrogenase E2 component (dihydrolipoamide acetyltransferase)
VGPAVASTPAGPDFEEEPPRPLTRMRRIIAERLTLSATTIPHFTITVAADVTALAALRAELKATGTNLTMTDFVLAATAQSLVEFPDVNSRTDGISVWPRRRVHLGVAVSLPAGLVVPVIRDAERLTVREIHERAASLAAAAREGRLGVDDMTGSTFTVSNLGMFGVDEFSAIINPGEAAILAVGSAAPTPVAMGDGIAVRTVMKLTLSADHRLVDGELGARFLNAVRRRLLDAEAFRWELAAG